eukprot:scaffold511489_cov37-Prasinocladus_malaysianus.AAC.1
MTRSRTAAELQSAAQRFAHAPAWRLQCASRSLTGTRTGMCAIRMQYKYEYEHIDHRPYVH